MQTPEHIPVQVNHQPRWVDGAVVYQIYPRSFMDASGDGIGDLPGIIDRLDYLQDLGVTAVWLSPFYPSPMADFGYDVSNYCDVDPIFGTLDDFKQLLAAAESRDIKVVIDIVPNHTSSEHPWFKASRESRDNEYSNWYVWKDPAGYADGEPQPPNNWRNVLTGESAWEWVPERRQFYLHSFDPRQPDLNWLNIEVHEAMMNVLRFWLELGVDGFRVDAVYWMAKDPLFHDDPVNPYYVHGKNSPYEAVIHKNSSGWPPLYTYLAHMADVLAEERFRSVKPRFMVTEAYPDRDYPVEDYMSFYESMDPDVAAPFNFEGISLPWEAPAWRDFLSSFHSTLEAFSSRAVASYAFGNHDQPRLVSRLGEARARATAVMQLTLPGMAFIYYGEELGMHDVDIPRELVQDPAALGDTQKGQGRDPERTPMQWSPGKHAGFSDAKTTWLPLSPDYATLNVETEDATPGSFLQLYRSLIALRRSSPALLHGRISVEDSDSSHVLAYTRSREQQAYLTIVNFSDKPAEYVFPDTGRVVISSLEPITQPVAIADVTINLKPHEAVVIALEDAATPSPQ